ncbi:hypothetical protein [Clostridium grantii]|uniref:Uncharacterized protein n=1 Tax=Clostridium grantii DSM 8605 TaxID=1121316 RepID=A0A1M5VV49_9CLOT|nr:hypothetical protein [Clostridium grantii]SHH79126.1 hypothetical protein SAMN02745207_02519 [Clostridium grantii DSM 8605]
MHYSKNNIIVKIENSNPVEYAILNPITGSFDLMNQDEYTDLMRFKNNENTDNIDYEFVTYILERGYVFHNSGESP